jgi:hypothetical protein
LALVARDRRVWEVSELEVGADPFMSQTEAGVADGIRCGGRVARKINFLVGPATSNFN